MVYNTFGRKIGVAERRIRNQALPVKAKMHPKYEALRIKGKHTVKYMDSVCPRCGEEKECKNGQELEELRRKMEERKKKMPPILIQEMEQHWFENGRYRGLITDKMAEFVVGHREGVGKEILGLDRGCFFIQ